MAFNLGDVIIERLQYGWAESHDVDPVPLYLLTQLQDTTINVTGDFVEVKDKDGNLIKKVWRSKAGTVEGQNTMINTNIIAEAGGTSPIVATIDNKIVMPKLLPVKADAKKVKIEGLVTGTVKVNQLFNNGSLGKAYKVGESANATDFVVTEGGEITLPTEEGVDQYFIRCDREVTEGLKIQNRIDKFPRSVKLIFKALYFDPCEKNALKGLYIVVPSFQQSPEISIPINTEATIDYKGDMEVDYCGADKVLYEIFFDNDEDEG